jgi:hypothetical protein
VIVSIGRVRLVPLPHPSNEAIIAIGISIFFMVFLSLGPTIGLVIIELRANCP